MAESGSFEILSEKPNLSLYVRQKVVEIIKGQEDWQWAIKLESGVLIINKAESETFMPDVFLAEKNFIFDSFSLSVHDTTMHFRSPETGLTVKFSLAPTKYAIHDPVHGGEVYPQWPEELEKIWGIPSVEGGEFSDEPSEEWDDHYKKLTDEGRRRSQREAQEFIKDMDDD